MDLARNHLQNERKQQVANHARFDQDVSVVLIHAMHRKDIPGQINPDRHPVELAGHNAHGLTLL